MNRHPDRLNATVLTLIAVALLGTGGYGLARGYGAFGEERAAGPVLDDGMRDFVARNADWFWPLAAVLAVLAAWAGLRWLLAQFSTPTVAHLPVRADAPGRTELSTSGAAAALAEEIGHDAGVRSAGARMVGQHPAPEVEITVEVHDDADVPAVRRRIEQHALPRFRGALEIPQLRARIHVRLVGPAGRTVR